MPTYEYRCTACGHEFEAFQSIKADPIRVCPTCGKAKVERKIGIGGAVIFKGGGFYETDYRSESYTKAAEAERKAATDGAAGQAAKPADGAAKPAGDAPKKDAAASAPAAPAPAAAQGSAPKEPPSKATHPSRVGRGAGNIIQNPPKPKGATPTPKPTPKPAPNPAPKAPGAKPSSASRSKPKPGR